MLVKKYIRVVSIFVALLPSRSICQLLAFFLVKGLFLRTCLHAGGEPQIGEVTCGGSPHQSCKHDQIKMRDYMDRRVTPLKWITSPSWALHVNRPMMRKKKKIVALVHVLHNM